MPPRVVDVAAGTVQYLCSLNPNAAIKQQGSFGMAILENKSSDGMSNPVQYSFEKSTLCVAPGLLVKAHQMLATK